MSFSDEFYTGNYETYDCVPKSKKPTSVIQALYSMADDDWKTLCDDTRHDPEICDPWELLAELQDNESMSCDQYSSPIRVYLSAFVSVLVHDSKPPRGWDSVETSVESELKLPNRLAHLKLGEMPLRPLD
jgi:hypothetical protein